MVPLMLKHDLVYDPIKVKSLWCASLFVGPQLRVKLEITFIDPFYCFSWL